VETAQLVLEYIKALAWPAVAVLGLLLFRHPLAAILHRLKGADLPGGVSLDFDKEVRDVETLSREVAKAPRKKPKRSTPMLQVTEANARLVSMGLQVSPSGLDMSRYLDLAKQDPNLALAGLRLEVEIIARNLAEVYKIEIGSDDSVSLLLRRLLDVDAITQDLYGLAQKIVRIGNAAVHGAPVSREEAEAVIDAARVFAKDYLAWLSWGFKDGWSPHGERSDKQADPADGTPLPRSGRRIDDVSDSDRAESAHL